MNVEWLIFMTVIWAGIGGVITAILYARQDQPLAGGVMLGAAAGMLSNYIVGRLLTNLSGELWGELGGAVGGLVMLLPLWLIIAIQMRATAGLGPIDLRPAGWDLGAVYRFGQALWPFLVIWGVMLAIVVLGVFYPDVFVETYYATLVRYIGVAIGVSGVMFGVNRALRVLGVKPEAATGFSLIMPWMVGFLIFTVFPVGLSVYLSFQEYDIKWDGPREMEDPLYNFKRVFAFKIAEKENPDDLWVHVLGVKENTHKDIRYMLMDEVNWSGNTYLIGAGDPYFWKGLWFTLRYTVLSVPLGLLGALGVALVLNQDVRGVGYWRTLYYLPAVLPAASVALLWYWLFAPNKGLINELLEPFLTTFSLERPGWFTDSDLRLPAFIIMGMWGVFGANTVILLAGLKNIPPMLYEAADIDGAGTWTKFRHITIPMLSPALFYNLVTNMIAALQIFTQQAFIQPEGINRTDGLFINWLIYLEAFEYGHMGYASAMGWLVAILIVIMTIGVFRSSSAWVFYEGDRREEGSAA
jgi:multiple sugar transport system permease protein